MSGSVGVWVGVWLVGVGVCGCEWVCGGGSGCMDSVSGCVGV